MTGSTPQKESFMHRIFPSTTSSKPSPSQSRSSSTKKKSKKPQTTPFMRRFRQTPPPSTMDKLQAKLSTSPDSSPTSVAARKRKAKQAKAKKDTEKKKYAEKKKSTSLSTLFFRRH
ncbi:hypothetical protein BG011_010031 [Mortierella polycephala]|uniref:Uncharacterized protein n=1 Tax=Mortierella polycephala TaxID=41804 RepID=A0A9P6TW84_9FUNG|nr:hypothetical protein BG011_010031 [Mortierella polycephala]